MTHHFNTGGIACLLVVCIGALVAVPGRAHAQQDVVVSSKACSGTLRIVHPSEGARLPFLRSTFVFGSADPRGALSINGTPVPIHPGGGFLAMVALSTGAFRIDAVLTVGATAYPCERTITVDAPVEQLPVTPLSLTNIQPAVDWQVSAGDELAVSCMASPGMEASFSLDGVRGSFPLLETQPGMYSGVYIVRQEDSMDGARVHVMVWDSARHKKIVGSSEGTILALRSSAPVTAQVAVERTVLRTGPGGTYMLFPPRGTKLRVTGRRGDLLRVRLNPSRDAWVAQKDVSVLPAGTSAAPVTAGSIAIDGDARRTVVRLALGGKVPFEVVPGPAGSHLDILLFGVLSKTDLIAYKGGDAVEQARWYQDDTETYRLRLYTRPGAWWGYDARFENGAFVFELRSPPVLRGTKPLEGITIAVDPGHSPDSGAVGPTGLVEKDANYQLALTVRERLAERGAKVVMTRAQSEPVSLVERPRVAFGNGADLLVSLHHNALPDGANPFEKNGYSVYYYHQPSMPLGRAVYDAYREQFGPGCPAELALRDDGFYYNDLAIPRTTQMPAILIESAYMILPREEALIKDARFRARCAAAVTDGIVRYVNSVCRREKAPAQKPLPKKPSQRAGK